MTFPIYTQDRFLEAVMNWIESGGSANVIEPRLGWSLLHLAAEFQNVAAIEYLIAAGADPNQRDPYGRTPLHIAVDSEIDGAVQTEEPLEFKATKRLIELGAETTLRDMGGRTPVDTVDSYGDEARKIFKETVNI
jgi:ankyrin repeat protein